MLQGSEHWLRISALKEHSMSSLIVADKLQRLEQDEIVELTTKLCTSGADGIEIARYTDVLQQSEQYFLVRGARRMLREWLHVWALLQELRRLPFRLWKRQRVLW